MKTFWYDCERADVIVHCKLGHIQQLTSNDQWVCVDKAIDTFFANTLQSIFQTPDLSSKVLIKSKPNKIEDNSKDDFCFKCVLQLCHCMKTCIINHKCMVYAYSRDGWRGKRVYVNEANISARVITIQIIYPHMNYVSIFLIFL